MGDRIQKCACQDPEIPTFCNRCGYEREPWQPIETAPKDGTRILICDRGIVEIAEWNDYYAWSLFYGESSTTTPTHWQPLPAPPEVAK